MNRRPVLAVAAVEEASSAGAGSLFFELLNLFLPALVTLEGDFAAGSLWTGAGADSSASEAWFLELCLSKTIKILWSVFYFLVFCFCNKTLKCTHC